MSKDKSIGDSIAKSVMPTMTEAPAISKSVKEAAKEKLAQLIKEETRKVKGIFQCFESPGARCKIVVKKYPGIPHFELEMIDGETYEIPLYVARHLNGIDVSAGAAGDANTRNQVIGTCSYPIHGYKHRAGDPLPQSAVGSDGVPVPIYNVFKRVKRYGFQSMEFGGAVE